MELEPKIAQAIVRVLVKSAALAEQDEKQTKAAGETNKQIPVVVDTLVKAGYLTNDQRQKAAESLQDRGKALETLRRIAMLKSAQAEEPASIGKASTPDKDAWTQKAAAVSSSGSAADRQFLSSFGLSGR